MNSSDQVHIYFSTDTGGIHPCNYYQADICLEGSGILAFHRDSTYSIDYNYRIKKKGESKPLEVIKKDENGRFSYNASYCTEFYFGELFYIHYPYPSGSGEIIFHPFSGESWSANFRISWSVSFKKIVATLYFEEENGTLFLSFDGCYYVCK